MRKEVILKKEAGGKGGDHASIDYHMIRRTQIIKTARIPMDVDELEEAGPSKKTSADITDNATS